MKKKKKKAKKTVPDKYAKPEKNAAYEIERPLYKEGPNWNYKEYRDLMLSQEKAEKLPDLHFFNGEEAKARKDMIVMSSYPRSGNTLLRATLEKIMGIATGSDCNIGLKLNAELMTLGLAGEGLADRRVWVVKTHYPERYGAAKFGAERCIMLVRSPLDCMTSLFHMVASGTHDCSISDEDFVKFKKQWDEWIDMEITVWKDFHKFWLNAAIPVHIIRYEDICERPIEALGDLMKFVMCVPTIEGTKIESYIKLASLEKRPEVYKPRSGKVNGNMRFFDEEKLTTISLGAGKEMKNLGYYHLVSDYPKAEGIPEFINKFNQKTLDRCVAEHGKRRIDD